MADSRFAEYILPNLEHFNQENALFFLDRAESNNQVYNRSRACSDHKRVKECFARQNQNRYPSQRRPNSQGRLEAF